MLYRLLPFFAGIALGATACGTDVNLGGPLTDGGTSSRQACDPCASDDDCSKSSACTRIGTNAFCAPYCDENGCDAGLTCDSTIKSNGKSARACVPTSGLCAPAATTIDAGTCGALNGPNVTSSCSSCDHGSRDCQANGCYGAWWCNTASRDCVPPPASCP